MKKMKKVLALAACAVLLVTASVMGTLAYLTSQATVTNTFTVGNVTITLDETKVNLYGKMVDSSDNEVDNIANAARSNGNTYKLIPGHTYTKDPTITVDATSEDCWLFVKVDNDLESNATITWSEDWEATGTEGYWAYTKKIEVDKDNVENNKRIAFTEFKFAETADPADYENKEIEVTAYAIQADNLNSWQDAWTALANQDDNIPDVNVTP